MIERHFSYNEHHIKRANKQLRVFDEEAVKDSMDAAEQKQTGYTLAVMFNESRGMFCESIMLRLKPQESARYLKLAALFGRVNFEFVNHVGEVIEFDVDGRHVTLTGKMKSDYVGDSEWADSLMISIMARDQQGIAEHVSTSEDIFDQADVKGDQFSRAFARLMKGVFQPDSNLPELFTNAWKAFDPDAFEFDRTKFIAENDLPALQALRCVFTEDGEAEYQAAIKEAVLKHQAYWSREKDCRDADLLGWISIPLTGIAALAYDHKGYKLGFETDYIPSWVAYHEFE